MKVAVLLSGGVDSSVALNLVKNEGGHEITAFYLKIWLEDDLAFLGDCPWSEDLKFARAVCEQAGVPLEVVPLQSEYHERVVSHALRELKAGRTPSPDILCNQQIKFGMFMERLDLRNLAANRGDEPLEEATPNAQRSTPNSDVLPQFPTSAFSVQRSAFNVQAGRFMERIETRFDKVVSGHYARVEPSDGTFFLKRSPDAIKDQTYFLSALNQAQLSRLWCPLGPMTKRQVRSLAQEMNLPNRDRRDSQGICFLGKIKYPEFVRYHLGQKTGDIIDIDRDVKLGEHRGVWFHTIGQRQGLGLAGGPWYVVRKDLDANRVLVAHADNYLNYARKQFIVNQVNWIAGPPHHDALHCKVRHSPHLAGCTIRPLDDQRWEISLQEIDQGIAPGQSAVFYEGETCLGGGVIE